jgi:aryl-alcohol dehydrogenase-like predicted oxidoreductase
MKYNQLGSTGLFVSEICLGAMTFGSSEGGIWTALGQLGQTDVDAIIGRSLAAGVNFIDTADVYSFGASEKLVGQALKNLAVPRQDIVIATKVPRAGISWTGLPPAWSGCRPIISISTRFMGPIR